MPKTWNPPALTYCDFCSRQFRPLSWNQRTCLSCFVSGCPDQSRPKYDLLISRYWSTRRIDLKAPRMPQDRVRLVR